MFNFFKVLFSPIIAVLDFVTKYFKTVVFLTIVYFIATSNEAGVVDQNSNANLQKIELRGPIMDVQNVLEDIEEARSNPRIKGVLFEVSSPGGAVAPSVELSYAIKELAKTKPVVAYASGIMASGSYYASIWANKIIANPGSIVGSIGVIFQGTNVEELMDKIGLKTQTVKAGRFKESGTPTRSWQDYERAELEKVIEDTYDIFITDVALARNLKKENHKQYADAHIFTSRQAKKVGLIDEVGVMSTAEKALYKLSNVKHPVWVKEDKFEKFMDQYLNKAITNITSQFSAGLKAY